MYGAAALFKKKSMAYVDGHDSLRIGVNLKGEQRWFEIPKDGYSDVNRFTEALTEKLPLIYDARCTFEVFPPPLSGIAAHLSPEDYLAFVRAWEVCVPKYTTHRWGLSFQTLARDYYKEGAVKVLDLSGDAEHYYNIVLTKWEKDVFEKVNPGLKYTLCDEECTPLKGFMHYHGVHGYYRGSSVDGVACAPPFRLCEEWYRLPDFTPNELLDSIEAPGPIDSAALTARWVPDGYSFTSRWEGSGDGAKVLAEFCEEVWACADWATLCNTYLSSSAAIWASPAAYIPAGVGQDQIRECWDVQFQNLVQPLLRGKGVSVLKILQHVWMIDATATKTMANYFLVKIVSGVARCAPSGFLRD